MGDEPKSGTAPLRLVALTPELWERVRRIAEDQKIPMDQVVADAVGVYWVRYGCRKKLRPEAW